MITGNTVTKCDKSGRTVYTLSYEEYNGIATFTINHVLGTATLLTPQGISWFTYSFREDDDKSEYQAVEAVLWPLQDAGIAAFTPLVVGRPVPVAGYMISTSWMKIFFGDPVAQCRYAAAPGGMLYELRKPEKGIVEALNSGDPVTFLKVNGW